MKKMISTMFLSASVALCGCFAEMDDSYLDDEDFTAAPLTLSDRDDEPGDIELVSPEDAKNSRQDTEAYINGFFVNQLSGRCIDVYGAPSLHNGANLVLWDCEYSGYNADNGSVTDQRWQITSQGFIQNVLSGKCIDVHGAPGTHNGSNLMLWDCEFSGYNADNGSVTDQRW